MSLRYMDFLKAISSDELYEGLLAYGLFPDRLPPVFTSVPFYEYCINNKPNFNAKWHNWITFSSMRNVFIPRQFGIPVPMQYQKLCTLLSDNWMEILEHFGKQTQNDNYRVSRVHIRKEGAENSLFRMSYEDDAINNDSNAHEKIEAKSKNLFDMMRKDWKTDGDPEIDLLIQTSGASRYKVKADISTCFPSIYTHSIPWALVGKEAAKSNMRKKCWYNEIDKVCREMKNGETHGLLIGPHTSNLLSEVILTVVDKKLRDKGYGYFRKIDDYTCYVCSHEEAQRFLRDLEDALREFDLLLNHKKTEIISLPTGISNHWIHELHNVSLKNRRGMTTYTEVNAYLDTAISLMYSADDAAVLKWAIKTLSNPESKLTDNAKSVAAKRIMHLAVLYPYLLHIMEEHVFSPFDVSKDVIKTFAETIYKEGKDTRNDEEIYYSLFFALKHGFTLEVDDPGWILERGDCISMVLDYLYVLMINRGHKKASQLSQFKNRAKELISTDMDRFWLFCYEVQSVGNIPDEWKKLKKANVSFIKPVFVTKRH